MICQILSNKGELCKGLDAKVGIQKIGTQKQFQPVEKGDQNVT
jgi:hypothetical protein